MLDTMRTIMDKFVPITIHFNGGLCLPDRKLKSRTVEFTLVNKKLITLKSNSRSWAPNPLTFGPNHVEKCQMAD